MSHSMHQLGKENMQFIVEAERGKEESIGVSAERVSKSGYIGIITELIQLILDKRNI